MKTAVCQYSLHRTIASEKWSLAQYVTYVKSLGVDGIDFHVRLLPEPEKAASAILEAISGTGLEIAGLSLSTNFNRDDPQQIRTEIETVRTWLGVASEIGAPVSRVFGGRLPRDAGPDRRRVGLERVIRALRELAAAAEEAGVVPALENHGGLPCTGEEQAFVIREVGSPFVRATVDTGNYLACPDDPVAATRTVADVCAYVHFKDGERLADGRMRAAAPGEGQVDLTGCLRVLAESGYTGFVALEYEAETPELEALPRAVNVLRQCIQAAENRPAV